MSLYFMLFKDPMVKSPKRPEKIFSNAKYYLYHVKYNNKKIAAVTRRRPQSIANSSTFKLHTYICVYLEAIPLAYGRGRQGD